VASSRSRPTNVSLGAAMGALRLGSADSVARASGRGQASRESLLVLRRFSDDALRYNRAEEPPMPLFLIERAFAELVPTDPEIEAVVKKVNDEIGIQWLFSFLSADKRKTYCLYEAPTAAAIRAAAERLGIPADTIVEVEGIGPHAAAVAGVRATIGR
jgi:hypothetical protein